MNEIEHRLKSLKEITSIQCSNGNWNYDPYMHGCANGMLLAIATLENSEYVPLEAPKEWLKDKNTGLQPPEYISEQQGIKMKKDIAELLQQFANNAMGDYLFHRHQKALKQKDELKNLLNPKDWDNLHDAWIHLVSIANKDTEGFCKTIFYLKEKYKESK